MVHKCKSFKEYSKIERKYCKRLLRRHRGRFMIDEFYYYQVLNVEDVETIKHFKIYKNSVNLPIILNQLVKHIGKTMEFEGGNVGKFIGIEMTNEDYYYMYEVDGKVKYQSCVGGIYEYKEI